MSGTNTTSIPAPGPTAPVTSDPPLTVVTVVTTASSQGPSLVTTRLTSTASQSLRTTRPSTSGSGPSTVSSSSTGLASDPSRTSVAVSGGGGGLDGTARVVVAVVVPIVGVALIAIALLFVWKQRQKSKAQAEDRRKEVEEYGYNPNHGSHAAAAAGVRSGDVEETPYEMAEDEAAGYRGWGSTNGGRKPPNMSSGVGANPLSPVGMTFSEGNYPRPVEVASGPDGYVGVATSPSTSTFPTGNPPSTDGNSNAPLVNGRGNRPGTADSSVVGAMNGPLSPDNPEGVHRGISNASSNYSAITHSTQSDMGPPLSHHDAQYYGADTVYEDGYYYGPPRGYSDDTGYGQPPPVIRDVQARRNTRIETPTNTHLPQQGNSGIAQNF